MLRGDTVTSAFQGYWPSSSPAPGGTRVRGFDEPPEATSGSPAASSSRTPSGSSCSYGETASGRQKVTNLRLPGQYDERLFAAAGLSGLQGPYYNWNRWYLPSTGRYLELDPIALGGKFNGFGTPDWYNYALGNPVTVTDPNGENPLVGALAGGAVCGPPCALGGFLAMLAASAVLGKIGSDIIDQCRDTSKDKSNDCYEEFKKCGNGPIGGRWSFEHGYSQCQICLEQCIQEGFWPARSRLTGGRCR